MLLIVAELASCANTRPLPYLQGQFDTTDLSKYEIKDPVIQIGDLISILVYSDNPDATALYNLPNGAGTQGPESTGGYLVDKNGDIELQGIGTVHIAGLNKQQLTELLNNRLGLYLKNPHYNIRLLNYKITLIGEVLKEGVYSIPNERINILESIGLAGGLTKFARKENVMIVREANGKREFARLDLTKPEVMKSPYYYLQQNDMVIVEQSKSKPTASEEATARNLGIISTLVSTLAIVYTILITNK